MKKTGGAIMVKTLLKFIGVSTTTVLLLSIPAYAGIWQPVDSGWKYQNDDGSFAANTWLSDNGSNYYFGSDGIMLTNTLSPDGFPLGRDGKKLSDDDTLPLAFPGTEADYDAYTNEMMDYFYGYHKQFTDIYGEIHTAVLGVYGNQNYEEVRNSISYLDTFDFTPYMLSSYAGISKIGTLDEIFRIEQSYYMYELVRAAEQNDSTYHLEICNKMDLSADKYFGGIDALFDRSILWGQEL